MSFPRRTFLMIMGGAGIVVSPIGATARPRRPLVGGVYSNTYSNTY